MSIEGDQLNAFMATVPGHAQRFGKSGTPAVMASKPGKFTDGQLAPARGYGTVAKPEGLGRTMPFNSASEGMAYMKGQGEPASPKIGMPQAPARPSPSLHPAYQPTNQASMSANAGAAMPVARPPMLIPDPTTNPAHVQAKANLAATQAARASAPQPMFGGGDTAKPGEFGAGWRVNDTRGITGKGPAGTPRFGPANLARAATRKNIGIGGSQGMASVNPADSHAALRKSIRDGFLGQIADAQAKGDISKVAELAGHLGRMDTGGFADLSASLHDAAMNEAKRDEVGAKIGLMDSKAGKVSQSPEQAGAKMFEKSGNMEAADAMERKVRMNANSERAKLGGAYPIDSRDIDETLKKYEGVPRLLDTAQDGSFSYNGDLSDIHAEIKALGLPGHDNPNSEISQAIAAKMRQVYGANISKQLFVPKTPKDYANGRDPSALSRGLGSYFSLADNVWHGHFRSFNPFNNPYKDRDAHQEAVDAYNKRVAAASSIK